jgi:hypothetical protein
MFKRGDIVHHKIMGKGIVLNLVQENNEEKVEVRMANGHIEKFYSEELETDELVKARNREYSHEIARGNEERAKRYQF